MAFAARLVARFARRRTGITNIKKAVSLGTIGSKGPISTTSAIAILIVASRLSIRSSARTPRRTHNGAASSSAACAPARPHDPYFPRDEPVTLIYDRIEAIWEPIDRDDDWSGFDALVEDIRALGRVLS